ncbi:MAG TPA: thioredoxin domain-containing protein [Acidimicrobiales bacterium]|nr:thioredoxin domain-containing protein [Acidimicrobiales bacterium]
MAIDVTDATFETEVLERSDAQAVVIDLWAPWCGPCRSLGPILEKVIGETEDVILCKVNVDENPQISEAFQVQSIPAVYAIKGRAVVDGFMGAIGEEKIREFAKRLNAPPSEADALVELGDEPSLRRALELEPDHVEGVTRLATLLIDSGSPDEALLLLGRVPETQDTRHLAARARLADSHEIETLSDTSAIDARLAELLETAKEDEAARQEYLDLLEAMDDQDERKVRFRKALTSRLF